MLKLNNDGAQGYRPLRAAGLMGCQCQECSKESENKDEIDSIIESQYSDKSDYTKNFIRKSILRFGPDHFSYHDTNRIDNNRTKVTVHCNYCGRDFLIDPYYFVTSKFCYGCPTCNPGRSTKKTKEIFVDDLFNKFPDYVGKYDFSESTDYKNESTVIKNIKCLKHDKYFSGKPSNLMFGRIGCPDCVFESRSYSILLSSFNKALDKIVQTYTGIYTWDPIVFDPTQGIQDKEFTFYCPIHGSFKINKRTLDYWKFDPCVCPDCITTKKRLKQGKIYFDKLQLVFDPKFYDCSDILTNYISEDVPFKIKCLKHGTVFDARISNALKGTCGCKQCSKRSKGETYTEKWLIDHNIPYESEKIVIDINGRYGSFVKIDFVFSIDNINYWIECNGEQHYKWVPRFQETIQDYQEQIKRDLNVRTYCKENNITLIEIPYTYYRPDRLNQVLEDLLINGKSYDSVITKVPKILTY